MEIIVQWVGLLGVLAAIGLAVAGLVRSPRTSAQFAFAVGLLFCALDAALTVSWLRQPHAPENLFLQRCGIALAAFVPLPWFLFGSLYAREVRDSALQRKLAGVVGAGLLLLFGSVAFWEGLVFIPSGAVTDAGMEAGVIGYPGVMSLSAGVIGGIGILMNLERTYRASVGTIRWRVKFMILGLGLLFVARIYTGSQLIIGTRISPTLLSINLISLPIACALLGRSLVREGTFRVAVYPSRAVLQNSITAIVAGAYLLLVGLMAKMVGFLGGPTAAPVKAFLVLAALVALAVLLASDRVQQQTRLWVSRHFTRPVHDSQKVWHSFTEATASLTREKELSRAVARLISETFQAMSVTVWTIDDNRDRLVCGASTLLNEAGGQALAEIGARASDLRQVFSSSSMPVDMDVSKEPWVEDLKQCSPDYFRKGGHRVCVPLFAGGKLLGLITIADRVNGLPFQSQDFDLLKCIGDQVAANLLNVQLSQKLLQAKEMEAFQTMSAFFVHDLKNTASTLSLMLRNLPTHFEDPQFRQDALRATGKSVERINTLISRLSLLRQNLEMNLKPTDLNQVVEGVLTSLEPAAQPKMVKQLASLPPLKLDSEQMQKVVTNLVLNAWEAIEARPGGVVRVTTARDQGWAVLSVADNGCGMTPEFISRSLFRPFQTTKKKGIGIGMFHTKVIVEAHRGKIEVSSEAGHGTTFRVLLPLEEQAA